MQGKKRRPPRSRSLSRRPIPEYIDGGRVCDIFAVDYRIVERMARSGLFRWRDCEESPRKQVQVHYQSLVDFCDRLREQYKIADRRPMLSAPNSRHRDEDLPPFPLRDSIPALTAMWTLGFYKKSTWPLHLIEEGHFDAYRLFPEDQWRISRSSLEAFIDRSRRGDGSLPVFSHP